ncbi:hypothetical protein K469DRAFT_695551 [Zopfia rhizophila CBS 207.26]|uniref:Uncharacterized protein n=1 Tax=Zopfia rhizophila CBS 207.26 TaxID=1314779 RepID=A0A6A6DJX8_9PEZI|nr:hypothetical protein K469DRAFT_695551 [Zopfia rhizophila CBS 207.26]
MVKTDVIRDVSMARLILSQLEDDAYSLSDLGTAIANMLVSLHDLLLETVLHLSRPLIQTLDDRTIVFIHFTVQEYLVSSLFVQILEAKLIVTLSCLIYLNFSANLLNARIPDDQRAIDITKGFYSLLPITEPRLTFLEWYPSLLLVVERLVQYRNCERRHFAGNAPESAQGVNGDPTPLRKLSTTTTSVFKSCLRRTLIQGHSLSACDI